MFAEVQEENHFDKKREQVYLEVSRRNEVQKDAARAEQRRRSEPRQLEHYSTQSKDQGTHPQCPRVKVRDWPRTTWEGKRTDLCAGS